MRITDTDAERLAGLDAAATRATLLVDFDRREHGVDQLVYLVRGTNNTLTVAFGTSDGNENDLPLLAAARNALAPLLADRADMLARITRLEEYCIHKPECNRAIVALRSEAMMMKYTAIPDVCTCGLDTALAETQA